MSILHGVTLGGTGKENGDRHPKIRHGVMIGAGAKILGNIEVGHCARIAAGSVVVKPVPHNVTVAGVPAKVVGEAGCAEPSRTMDQMLNAIGLCQRLRNMTVIRRSALSEPRSMQKALNHDRESVATRHAAWRWRATPPSDFDRKTFANIALENAVDVQEVRKLDAYLKRLFGNQKIRVVPRPKKDNSAEVYIGEEFIGVLFVDDEDDDRSFQFQMAILEDDLVEQE